MGVQQGSLSGLYNGQVVMRGEFQVLTAIVCLFAMLVKFCGLTRTRGSNGLVSSSFYEPWSTVGSSLGRIRQNEIVLLLCENTVILSVQ
ncbi:hypothetical protein AAFF_G00100280 [Aldrovandia affinis]|uniref:Uncharacterized protein n=1 Tax=Aldrovandia affinis TaxID=143900 RepID=A0AAD7VWR9_9TELE|nr:hypothetical protein AAFF_G00100280 [Aldrovandia affinis]